jgi:hypothetical protein
LGNSAKHFSLTRGRHESVSHADAFSGGFSGAFSDAFSKDRVTVTLTPPEAAVLGADTFEVLDLACRVLAFWSDVLQPRDPDPPPRW